MIRHQPQQSSLHTILKQHPSLSTYPTSINVYSTPPSEEITLTEFEKYGLDRLQCLLAIENVLLRYKEEQLSLVDPVIQKHMPLYRSSVVNQVGVETLLDQRRKDLISHYVLRLAYCKTIDLRNWFVKVETQWLKKKLQDATVDEREYVFQQSMGKWDTITFAEFVEIAIKRYGATVGKVDTTQYLKQYLDLDESAQFFKVPFESVADLVGKRKVVVIGGTAYLPSTERSSLLLRYLKLT
jgi:DNA primase large subunit